MIKDSYAHILILVTQDPMGGVSLEPMSNRRKREVSRSNLYNGSYSVYYQEWEAEQFMEDFPKATYRDYNGELRVNSGCRILVDSWEYRHRVGGQCG